MMYILNSLAEAYDTYLNATGHEFYSAYHRLPFVYEYDPAEDGPEVDIIKSILASHRLYVPGKEREVLALDQLLNEYARRLYDNPYRRLGPKRKLYVRQRLIDLHSGWYTRLLKEYAWSQPKQS